MKLKFCKTLVLVLMLVGQTILAQEKTVSGTVKDIDGLPLPGVAVLEKGTSNGIQTDFDGNYKLNVKEGSTLVFSYIGMQTQEVQATSAILNVILKEDVAELSGVVITALGIKKSEKAITYAAQELKGEDMTEAREQNVVNALSGKIAGVQVTNSSGSVGSSSRIILRGQSTLLGNSQPLFVVDGVPFDNTNYGNAGSGGGRDLPNGAASINPDDIESITVLKGPTASALYGIRAANGVILITTKSGKNGKIEVSFNTNTTFSNPLKLPSFQNSYGQGATSDYFEYVDGAGGGTNDGVDESWGPALDRGLEFIQWDSYKNGGAPTPWVSHPNNVKNFYDTGITVSNSLSFAGGNDLSKFRLSVGNTDDKGMIPFTEFKKFNVGFNGSLNFGDKLTVGTSATYFNNHSDNLPTVGYNNQNVVQQFIWSARNVNFSDLRDWRNLPLAPEGTAAEGTPLNWNNNYQNNPYWVLETNRNTLDLDRLNGQANINYAFSDKFSVSGKIMLDQYSQRETIQSEKGTNEYKDGYYAEINRRFRETNAEALATYQTDITEDLNFKVTAGGNSMRQIYTRQLGELDGGIELAGLFTLSNPKSGTTPTIDSDYTENRINSLLGFGEFAYKSYAFLNFTARNDWSSVLPAKNNSYFFPSISGSLIMSDILGFSDSAVQYLKLRGGWSQVGGAGPLDAYSTNPTYDLSSGNFGTLANIPNRSWNPEIKPQFTTGYEVGMDITAFHNRLRFSGTYYNQTVDDAIFPVGRDSSTTFEEVWDNAGKMVNKGIEVQLGGTVVKNDNFSFDVDVNFAKNDNTVESLGGIDAIVLGGQWGMELQAREGMPYGVIMGFPYARTDSGEIIYENGLPKVNNSELVALGDIQPDWTGGLSFTLKYKGFDFNTLFDAKMGGELFSMTYMWGRYAGTLDETLIGRENGVIGDGVMSDGNGGYVPNNVVQDAKTFNQHAYDYSNFTETGVFDASYVKLRQIVIGYSIPNKLLQGTFIRDMRVSLVGRNLALLYSKVPHIDPETGFSNANGEQGQEFGQLPSARTYGFNVNIKF